MKMAIPFWAKHLERYLPMLRSKDFPPWAYNFWAGMYGRKFGPANDNQWIEEGSASSLAYMRWRNPLLIHTRRAGTRWDEAWEERIV